MAPSAAQRLLRAHLDAGAPAREAFIARLFLALTTVALAAILVLQPYTRDDVVAHLPAFAPMFGYHAGLLVAVRRGWFHPAVPWVSALIQTSMLAVPYYFAVDQEGVAFVVGSSMRVGWVSVVAASALHADPKIRSAPAPSPRPSTSRSRSA